MIFFFSKVCIYGGLIPAFKREGEVAFHEFQASQGYMLRPCLNNFFLYIKEKNFKIERKLDKACDRWKGTEGV